MNETLINASDKSETPSGDYNNYWYLDAVGWRNRPEEISSAQVSVHLGRMFGDSRDPRKCRVYINVSTGPIFSVSKRLLGRREHVVSTFQGCEYECRPIREAVSEVVFYDIHPMNYPACRSIIDESAGSLSEEDYINLSIRFPGDTVDDIVFVTVPFQAKLSPADTVVTNVGDSNQFIPFNEIPYSPSLVESCGIVKTFGWVMRHDIATRMRKYLRDDFFYWKRI